MYWCISVLLIVSALLAAAAPMNPYSPPEMPSFAPPDSGGMIEGIMSSVGGSLQMAGIPFRQPVPPSSNTGSPATTARENSAPLGVSTRSSDQGHATAASTSRPSNLPASPSLGHGPISLPQGTNSPAKSTSPRPALSAPISPTPSSSLTTGGEKPHSVPGPIKIPPVSPASSTNTKTVSTTTPALPSTTTAKDVPMSSMIKTPTRTGIMETTISPGAMSSSRVSKIHTLDGAGMSPRAA